MFKQKRVLNRILLSYITFVIIPTALIGVITINVLLNNAAEDAKKVNFETLSRLSNTIDEYFRQVNSLSYQLSVNSSVIDFAEKSFDSSVLKKYESRKIMQQLQRDSFTLKIFDSVGIYYKKNNCIITDTYMYEPEEYYNQYFVGKNIAYESWLNKLNSISSTEFLPNIVTNESYMDNGIVAYTTPLIIGEDEGAVLIALIESKTLISSFQSLFENNNSYFVVLDKKNNIVGSLRNIPFNINKLTEKLLGEKFEFKSDSVKYIGNQINSNIVALKYIYLIPENSVIQYIFDVKMSYILLVTVTLIFVLVMLYFIIREKYKSLQNAVDLMKADDFRSLDTFMRNVLNENNKLTRQIDEQIRTVRSKFLSRLIWDSNSVTASELDECDKYFDVHFNNKNYCAVIVKIENTLCRDEVVTNFQVIDILESIFTDANICSYVIPDSISDITYILNTNRNSVTDVLQEAYKFIHENLGADFVFAVGLISDSITGYSESYEQAALVLRYALKNGQRGVVEYFGNLLPQNTIYYSQEKEFALIQSIKKSNTQQALAILNSLYDININNRNLDMNDIRLFNYSIVSSIIKIIDDAFINETDKNEIIMLYKKGAKNSDFSLIKRAVEALCAAFEKSNTENDYELQIKNYIEKHYCNNELSLAMMAKDFNYSYTYMSNLFKNTINKNFTEYINDVRLSKAKELLLKTEKKINDIAVETGYTSSATFIKLFKKKYLVTPNDLRKQYRA